MHIHIIYLIHIEYATKMLNYLSGRPMRTLCYNTYKIEFATLSIVSETSTSNVIVFPVSVFTKICIAR